MKKIFQTKFGKPEGNCFPACVASILEIEIERIPNYQEGDGVWYQNFKKWLRKFDYECVALNRSLLAEKDQCPEVYGIVSGKSPRGLSHSTVYFKDEMVHDPHPEGGGVKDIEDVIYLIPKFPKLGQPGEVLDKIFEILDGECDSETAGILTKEIQEVITPMIPGEVEEIRDIKINDKPLEEYPSVTGETT